MNNNRTAIDDETVDKGCRIKQYAINAQYAIFRDCPTVQMKLKGNKGTNCMNSKGKLQGSSLL